MPKLEELILRVQALDAPDCALEAEIHAELFGTVETHMGITYRDAFDRLRGHSHPYKFTQHVDGAEMALPGPEWPEYQITRRYGTGYHANVGADEDGVGCETAALALLVSALRCRAGGQQALPPAGAGDEGYARGVEEAAAWQPIETAPVEAFDPAKWYMSHSPTLLLWNRWPVIGSYGYTKTGKGRWRDHHSNIEPTHWMPLPAPPARKDAQ